MPTELYGIFACRSDTPAGGRKNAPKMPSEWDGIFIRKNDLWYGI